MTSLFGVPPPSAFCQSVVPPAFASFYFPAVSSSGVSCVTNCTEGAAGSIDCHWGRCRVTTGGPTCLYGTMGGCGAAL